MAYAILLISPGRWLQAKTQQPIGVVSLVIIIHVNEGFKGYGSKMASVYERAVFLMRTFAAVSYV